MTHNLNSSMNEGRYDDALKCCNELIEVDFANSRRWSAKIAEINSKKEKAIEMAKILLQSGVDIKIISQSSGLTIEEIENLL